MKKCSYMSYQGVLKSQYSISNEGVFEFDKSLMKKCLHMSYQDTHSVHTVYTQRTHSVHRACTQRTHSIYTQRTQRAHTLMGHLAKTE